MCVNNLPRVALSSAVAGIRTHDLFHHKSGFITTQPLRHIFEMYSISNVLAVTGS